MLDILPLSIEQYERMIAVGILAGDDPLELLEGYLVGLDQGNGPALPHPDSPQDGPRLGGLMPLWPLSIDQYQRMIAAGIIPEGAPIELLEGFLVAKDRGLGPSMSQGIPHRRTVRRTTRRLTEALPTEVTIQVQSPVDVGPLTVGGQGSEPEPDVAVAQGPEARYDDHHPRPEELHLVVEVAASSLAEDRNYKTWLYATASIRLYWIVNLADRQLEVHSDPDPATGRYRSREILREDQQVILHWEGLAPVSIPVKDLLP
jgi:Uma2 family endonuclease